MNSKLVIALLAVLVYLSSSSQASEASEANNDQMSADKRQLVPLPRIGRSLLYAKRQSGMLPSPRIGRSDPSIIKSIGAPSAQPKSPNAVDCTANPEMCETTGGSFGRSASNNNNEDLVEPIDIQLRAAFIPRLGKRGRAAYNEAADDRVVPESDSSKQQPPQYNRKWILIPGLGYIDAEAAAASSFGSEAAEAAEQAAAAAASESDSELIQQQLQRNALIRSLVESSMKRAMPYTPRIGRAVFAPRIGKKATFVPRIG